MQYNFLGVVDCGENRTFDGLILALWSIWSEGNTAYTTRRVNGILSQLEARIQNVATRPEATPSKERFYWVNVAVGDDDVEKIDELFPTPEVTFRLLTAVLVEGLKVSFSVNAKNDMTVCSLSDRRTDSDSFGACLTGGADGWYDALCVCLYKYTALLQGDLNNGSVSDGERKRIM